MRVAGISTTVMDQANPRYSGSEDLLAHALGHAQAALGAEARLIRLGELSFRSCEGYYSKSASACTWPCSITQMDPADQLDRVYEALRASGQLDRTVIVFTSDNGFVLGEHGRVDKRTAYEDSIRIPLIIRHPGLGQAGSTVSSLVLNLDLAPTLVDFAGAPAPVPYTPLRSHET